MTPEQRQRARDRERAWRLANPDRVRAHRARDNAKRAGAQKLWREENPKRNAYLVQRGNAKHRGIDFLFTYEEWLDFWGDKFDQRGGGPDDLCCGRYADQGPYHPSNCYITTNRENARGPLNHG